MLSGTLTGHVVKYPDLESNQDQDLRTVLCCPLHHRDKRADDWICTSIIRFTRPAPYSVEPRRRQGDRPGSNRHMPGPQPGALPIKLQPPAEGEGFEPSRRLSSTGFQPGPVANRVALPFLFSSPTRIRTWNAGLEAWHDVRFTIEP